MNGFWKWSGTNLVLALGYFKIIHGEELLLFLYLFPLSLGCLLAPSKLELLLIQSNSENKLMQKRIQDGRIQAHYLTTELTI